MAKAKKASKSSKKQKLVQLRLPVGTSKQVTCAECNFKYVSTKKESRKQHELFHNQKISGFEITKRVFNKLKLSGKKVHSSINAWSNEEIDCFVVSCSDKEIMKVVEEMLMLVNLEWLNSEGNSSVNWKKRPYDCKVVLLVSANFKTHVYRIMGILTTDRPTTPFTHIKGYHMDVSTSTIDPEKSELELEVGVSRIFVSQKYRRHHLAEFMLNSMLQHAVSGKTLSPWQVGFSQPSDAGGRLLHHWINTTTATASSTVPVYEEK